MSRLCCIDLAFEDGKVEQSGYPWASYSSTDPATQNIWEAQEGISTCCNLSLYVYRFGKMAGNLKDIQSLQGYYEAIETQLKLLNELRVKQSEQSEYDQHTEWIRDLHRGRQSPLVIKIAPWDGSTNEENDKLVEK